MRIRSLLGLVLIGILLGLLLIAKSAAPKSLAPWAVNAAPPVPDEGSPGEGSVIEFVYPDVAGREATIELTATTAANGFFPGRWGTLVFTSTHNNLEDQNLHFNLEIVYPGEYVDYFTAAPTPIEWNERVTECTHDGTNHKFDCTGFLPSSDPTLNMDVWVRIAFIGTCDLYTDPQPNYVSFDTTIEWVEVSEEDKVNTYQPVEPTLDLALSLTPANGASGVIIEDENHQGAVLGWSSPHDYTCGDGSDPINQDVSYLVELRKVGGDWTTFDEQGPCYGDNEQLQLDPTDLACESNGDPGTYEWRIAIGDIRYAACGATTEHTARFSTGSCRPTIEKVESTFGNQYFLQNIQVPNPYRVEVDWNGEAYVLPPEAPYGQVLVDVNGKTHEIAGESWGVEREFNMGGDFAASLTGGSNVMEIRATYRPDWAAQDLESEKTVLQPMVFPVPEWLTELALGDFTIDLKAATVSYGREFQYPDPAFKAQYGVPDVVPYIGGAQVGIIDTASTVGFDVSSDGSGSVGLGGRTGVQLTENKKVKGSVEGEGRIQLGSPEGVDLTGATFGLDIEGEIAEEMGVADLVPAIKAAENWWLVGRLVKWFNNRANVQATLSPKVEIEADFKDVNDELTFDSGTGTGSIDILLELTLSIIDSLKASVFGGAKPQISVQVPAADPYGYLKEISIGFRAGVKLVAWIFEETWEKGVTCGLPGGCQSSDARAMARSAGPSWSLIERDYLGPDYARFVANRPDRQLDGASPTTTTSERAITQQVFPHANPALAIRADDRQMMLWIHDDPAKPLTQSLEIQSAYSSGGGWISATVTSDTLLDFAPQVAFDADGDAVAVWERARTPLVAPSLNVTFVQALEIASAQWLSNTQQWGDVVTLTQDSLVDTSPQLARGQDGTLLSLWRTVDGADDGSQGSLLGTAAHPLTLTYAVWTGDTWTPPAAALANLTGTIGVDVAVYSATQAALVLVRDLDGDEGTQGDQELFSATWDGNDWSGLTRLTHDTITDTAPSLTYDSQGGITLVWLHGDDLVASQGWPGSGLMALQATQIVRPASTSGAFLDYELVTGADDHVVLLWQTISGGSVDVGYRVYDAANDDWSADLQLTSDGALEESFAPVVDSSGDLHVAYNKVTLAVVTQTRTVEISPTLTVTVTEYVPEPGRSDLVQAQHTIGRDLGVVDGDVLLSNPNPAPGSTVTVSATVHNEGDLAVANGLVAFYDGDPDAGGARIGVTQTLPSPFSAATTGTVSVVWNVPAEMISHTLYVVVDPGDAVTETNEANNRATLAAVLPDLAVAWAHSAHTTDTLTLTAAISNVGPISASVPFTVAFRARDAVTGTLLGAPTVSDPPGINERVTVTLLLTDPAALAGAGDTFWAVADAGDRITEADEANNAAAAALRVLPDLTLAATDIQLGDRVTVTVHNAGVLTATGALLAVWEDAMGGTPIATSTVGALAPGGSTTVAFAALSGVGRTLWVKADPEDAIDESDEANNLAVRANCPTALAGVNIVGPAVGYVDAAYAFTAATVPTDVTAPISYTWAPTPRPGSLLLPERSVVTYTWNLTGTYVITLRAGNCGGSAVATHTITIEIPPHLVYLPLVMRNYQPPPPADRYVKRYGEESGDCSTPETACATIQRAVDVAEAGDVIAIAGYEDAYAYPGDPEGNPRWTYWATESRPKPSGYYGPDTVSQVVLIDESITLRGGYDAGFSAHDPETYKTVIRPGLGGAAGRGVLIAPFVAVTLEHLVILEGDANNQGGVPSGDYTFDGGGGVYALGVSYRSDALVIRNCTIAGNVASQGVGYGGGVYLDSRPGAVLEDNAIYGNFAGHSYGQSTSEGGGVYARYSDGVRLEENLIRDNVACDGGYAQGGGVNLYALADPTVQGNQVISNTGTLDGVSAIGGGLYLRGVTGGVVARNVISGNVAGGNTFGAGGGMSAYESEGLSIHRNLFYGNVAAWAGASNERSNGGGIRLGDACSNVTLANNFIVRNQSPYGGSGVMLDPAQGRGISVVMYHNTIADNGLTSQRISDGTRERISASAIARGSEAAMMSAGSYAVQDVPQEAQGIMAAGTVDLTAVNNVIAGHTRGVFDLYPDYSTLTFDHTLWHGNATDADASVTRTNDLYGDPAFVDAMGGDYHIGAGSAARDAGASVGVTVDFDGEGRDAQPDIGADEYK